MSVDIAWVMCGTPFTDRAYIALAILRKLIANGASVVTIHRSLAMYRYAERVGLPVAGLSLSLPAAGAYVVGHFPVFGAYGLVWNQFPTTRKVRVFHYNPRLDSTFLQGFDLGVNVEPLWAPTIPDLGGRVITTNQPTLIRDADELDNPAPPPFNELRTNQAGRHAENSFSYRVFYECLQRGMVMGNGAPDDSPDYARDRSWRQTNHAALLRQTPQIRAYANGANQAARILLTAAGG